MIQTDVFVFLFFLKTGEHRIKNSGDVGKHPKNKMKTSKLDIL